MNDQCLNMYEELIQNIENVFSQNISFRNNDGVFSMESSIIRHSGASKCGSTLLSIPNVDTNSSVLVEDEDGTSMNIANNESITQEETETSDELGDVYRNSLYELSLKTTERRTKNGELVEIIPNGSLPNIREYAHFVFRGDEDQKRLLS